ncbi:MAG: GTP-binding protein [Clostridiales bacterium]|nr:GTP-binding protein [Clostridiales bacterium]
MTKIDIISGFLGAGKTTLIKKMLEEVFKDEQVVLVENEYGEVGIDSGFLKDAGVEIRELNSGCICCTLVGDFSRSLNEVINTYHPDRILIEPSGVGKLSDVMTSVKKMEEEYPEVKLNALVTVANAMKATKQMKAFGEFFNNQIENATTIVLSRTQNAKPQQLELCVKMIQELNPKAAIVTTPWDEISGEQILKVIEGQKSFMEEMMAEFEMSHDHDHDHEEHEHHHDHDHEKHEHHHNHDHEEHEHHHDHDHEEHEHHHDHDHEGHEHHHDHDGECCCHDHDHHGHHHADDIFDSWGKETPHKFTKETIESILKTFCDDEEYAGVLRAKGMVPTEDGTWIYFDMVPGEYELREGEPDYTGRLCVIGTGLDGAKLEALFGL